VNVGKRAQIKDLAKQAVHPTQEIRNQVEGMLLADELNAMVGRFRYAQ
jgi:hypothetical protein